METPCLGHYVCTLAKQCCSYIAARVKMHWVVMQAEAIVRLLMGKAYHAVPLSLPISMIIR